MASHRVPTEWTTQQFREVLADLHPYRFVIHDRNSIFSPSLDLTLNDFWVRVIRTPVQVPTANAFYERLIGTIRRECSDYLIPLNQALGHRNQSSQGFRRAAIGIGLPSVTESLQSRSSADCITIIGWKRRSLNIRRNTCGPHGTDMSGFQTENHFALLIEGFRD
jgi:hypothetical protein